MCCPSSTKVAPALDVDVEVDDSHEARVLALLLEGGEIGLGEVEDNDVSLTTTLRYAVLRIAQSATLFCTSIMSLFACLCTSGGDEKLPEGATKYLVVEFNAWVYSGVRRRLIRREDAAVPAYPPTHTGHTSLLSLPYLRAAV